MPGDQDGLRWRTRQRFVPLPDGRHGMRKHRSHDVVPVDDCLIAGGDAVVPRARRALRGRPPRPGSGRSTRGSRDAGRHRARDAGARPGESVLDLYAGVGLFARFLADAVGAAGRGRRGRGRCRGLPARGRPTCPERDGARGDVGRVLAAGGPPVGPGRARPAADRARSGPSWSRSSPPAPRAVAYVACDPAALARDVAIFAEHGYAAARLRAFDVFPMTHHVECVALLGPVGALDKGARQMTRSGHPRGRARPEWGSRERRKAI